MSKLITIFGATGNQGGSVIEAILTDPQLSKEFKIRGITRDTSKKSAQDLAKRGVDVVSVRLDFFFSPSFHFLARLVVLEESSWIETNIQTGRSGLRRLSHRGAEGIPHCVPRHQLLGDYERRHRVLPGQECRRCLQGRWCFPLIFSSLHHVTEATKGRLTHVPHFDSKANVEKYIRASGVGCSFVLPGYYMSNFTQMLNRAEDGSYQLFYPVGKQAQFPLFDAAQDTGKTSLDSPPF